MMSWTLFGNKRSNRRRPDRRQQARAAAGALRDRVRSVLPWLGLAVVAVGVPTLIWEGYQHTVSSPYFRISQVETRGLAHLDRKMLLAHSGFTLPVNAFDVDPDNVRERIEAHPWVSSATVERRLPDDLRITVEEHRPVAIVVHRDAMWLVDSEGHPFKAIDDRDPARRLMGELPLISGLRPDRLRHGGSRELEDRALLAEALEVVELYQSLEVDERAPIAEVHCDRVMGISLMLAGPGIELRLGRGRYRERLQRFEAVWGALDTHEVERSDIEYILLDDREDLDRVVVGRRRTPETVAAR
jgi:cell division protein FtsQ